MPDDETWTLHDPAVRVAVKELLRANDDFRLAYSEWLRAGKADSGRKLLAVEETQRRINLARLHVNEAEERARTQRDVHADKAWGAH